MRHRGKKWGNRAIRQNYARSWEYATSPDKVSATSLQLRKSTSVNFRIPPKEVWTPQPKGKESFKEDSGNSDLSIHRCGGLRNLKLHVIQKRMHFTIRTYNRAGACVRNRKQFTIGGDFSKKQIPYDSTQLKCSAIMWSTLLLRCHLERKRFTHRAHHDSNQFAFNAKDTSETLDPWKRWRFEFESDVEQSFGVRHQSGDKLLQLVMDIASEADPKDSLPVAFLFKLAFNKRVCVCGDHQ